MITIPFSWFGFTDWLVNKGEPGLIVMFATFGMIPACIVFTLVMRVVGMKKFIAPVVLGMMSSMFISMMVLIPLLLIFRFDNIPKAMLVWMVVLGSCIVFFLTNMDYIEIWSSSREDKKKKSVMARKKRKK
jgi:RsiW-degrading membrane proteinase PrsW (M82 family)